MITRVFDPIETLQSLTLGPSVTLGGVAVRKLVRSGPRGGDLDWCDHAWGSTPPTWKLGRAFLIDRESLPSLRLWLRYPTPALRDVQICGTRVQHQLCFGNRICGAKRACVLVTMFVGAYLHVRMRLQDV